MDLYGLDPFQTIDDLRREIAELREQNEVLRASKQKPNFVRVLRLTVHPDWVKLASEWHGGQWTALYSVASTGFLYQNYIRSLSKELNEIHKKSKDMSDDFWKISKFLMWVNGVEEAFEATGVLGD